MSQTYSLADPATRRVAFLVVLTWAVLTGIALSFVTIFGFNLPYADEWEFVPAPLGKEPVAAWLWSQHNEHRLPLSRAIYYTLFRLTHDFRTGMFVQVILLSTLALALLRLAARVRGRADWTDLFFPVSLLHLGHWENFLMGYQICYVFFSCLVTILGLVAMRTQRETAYRSGVVVGVLLILIALTGGFGLAMIPAIVPWLLYLAVVVWRSGKRGRATVLLILALLPIVYLVVYFDGYQRPAHHPPPSSSHYKAIGMVTGEVLAMGLGIGVAKVWWLVLAGEFIVVGVTLRLLIRQARDPVRRPASIGVVAVLAGVFGLALAIGIGRAPFDSDEMGLWSRYAVLMWPLLGLMYLVAVRNGQRGIPMVLCLAAALAFVPNMATGMVNAIHIYQHDIQVERDARAGVPAKQLVERLFPNSPNAGQMERAEKNIPLLRDAGIGAFGGRP